MVRDLPPLNALLAFETVARTGSIRAAADFLSVTPGAVSRQIRLLDEHFGMPLFQRDGRGLLLTHAGSAYYQKIAPLFDGLRQAGQVLHRNAGRTVIRLHSFTTFATRWLIPRLTAFQLANPGTDIRLTTASEWDDSADFDAAIRLGEGEWTHMTAFPLIDNILVPVCKPTPARKILFKPEHLSQHTLLHVRGRPDDWRRWCDAQEININNLTSWVELESSALAYQAAIEGQGIALAQRELVRQEIEDGTLIEMENGQLDCGNLTYYLVWHSNSMKESALRLLQKWLTESP
ncbi:LysR substrate-binding domain-containing protein [Pantoea vagans]|uniref:LysR substrate-binding domain-containing protein n=1 Tax=Pantoea vagans TaxID=470934 RepID=UPI003FA39538